MNDEEKKEKQENVTAETPAKTESAEKKPVQATPAKEADTKKGGAITKAMRPKECANCNKSIKKKWYYRNGKFYCSAGCWKKSLPSRQAGKNKTPEGSEKPAETPKKEPAK